MKRLLPTSEIPLISSIHGEAWRIQRNISKRELKAAVKYGKKTKGIPHPKYGEWWIYEYADVTYITNSTSTIEITSWAKELPLQKYNISKILLSKNKEAK